MMEIIEGTAVEVSTVDVQSGWQGDFPFYLVIELLDTSAGNVGIDLDEPGWVAANHDVMRKAATWWLYHKESQRPVLCLVVEDGEQPYFVKHHVGNLMAGGEVVAAGIGKKVPAQYEQQGKRRVLKSPARVERLWILPNGVVCGADDVDIIAGRMLGG